jgi:hypothetical protein
MHLPLTTSLALHPACLPVPIGVDITVVRTEDGGLSLSYCWPECGVRVSSPKAPRRTDNLWQHTCAELFVAGSGGEAYREFNFAPSGEWAAYDFLAYRQRDDGLPDIPAPQISLSRAHGQVMLNVVLVAACLPAFARPLRVSVTTVIEQSDASLSYWALKHASAQPDFHQWASFVLSLDEPNN